MRLDFLGNIYAKSKYLFGFEHKSATVSGIGTKALHGWIPFANLFCRKDTCFCIVNVGRVR